MSLFTTDIREINWLTRLLVAKTHLLNFQTWLQSWAGIASQPTGLQGNIISGLAATAANGAGNITNYTCAVGYGTDQTGKPLVVNTPLTLQINATRATAVKCYLGLKFAGTGSTPTTTPADSGNLYTVYGATLELIVGTASAYPAIANNDLILLGVTLNTSGQITATDYSVASLPRLGLKPDSKWTNSLTNPTTIPAGQTLTHYNMTLEADLAVAGTLVTGNLHTTGFTLYSTGGNVINQF